jgi:hypothetical protein
LGVVSTEAITADCANLESIGIRPSGVLLLDGSIRTLSSRKN